MANSSLTVQLIHGRKDSHEKLADWGFDAEPIHGVAFFHGTYLSTFTIGFVSETASNTAMHQSGWRTIDELTLEVPRCGDLIQSGGFYFGDFELYLSP